MESIPDIPVHIGAADLKYIVYTTLLPLWLKWSRDMPLDYGEVVLRTNKWVELVPKPTVHSEDADAISSQFFKSRVANGPLKFTTGEADVWLHVSLAVYHEAVRHQEKVAEEEELRQGQGSTDLLQDSPEPVKKANPKGKAQGKGKATAKAMTYTSEQTKVHFQINVIARRTDIHVAAGYHSSADPAWETT